MFIELTTNKGERITFNTDNIVLFTSDRKGSILVDVNGIDWIVSETYETLKGILNSPEVDDPFKTDLV